MVQLEGCDARAYFSKAIPYYLTWLTTIAVPPLRECDRPALTLSSRMCHYG
ncbi:MULTISPECIES: hypothetical protein [unclassified Coleofasciculus]|uniref:hypothetical protein n=1 Tax=Cyanophyceae TaxID=3028117 RepID=UPI001686C3A5|nr:MULTISPECIES: hypothetical protein [unclassified Coleofasciculus]MBD1891971.1 hypothetical protein [Coleofasciculus sp. FACHB-SPT9]MBD2084033.1 hypothetical protein [Coleofasciculus sp. FACHB-542]